MRVDSIDERKNLVMELKIMEWNINQRMNYSGKNMPNWIADVIANEAADIIALTEVYKGNNWEKVKTAAFNSNYVVFETSNSSAGQNDVAIAININKLNVIYAKTYYPSTQGIPDYLEVKCKSKKTDKEFIFICIRIHASVRGSIRRQELKHTMSVVENEDTVIICGDFNNYRRGYVDGTWCLNEISKICEKYNFVVKTPEGSSIYEENPSDTNYEFPEDHFLLKGIEEKDFSLSPYDRNFMENDKTIYRWNRDFQVHLGSDKNGKSIYDSVPTPFPDHAILKGKVVI